MLEDYKDVLSVQDIYITYYLSVKTIYISC